MRKKTQPEKFDAHKAIAYFGGVTLIVSVIAFYFGASSSWQQIQTTALSQLKTRIALDSQYIGLANPLLEVPADNAKTNDYIRSLNAKLQQQDYPLHVKRIGIDNAQVSQSDETQLHLSLPDGTSVNVVYTVDVMPFATRVSALTLFITLIAMLLVWPWFKAMQTKIKSMQTQPEQEIEQKYLVVDLADKTIRFGEQGERVKLANKPLCFYLALLEFAVEHSGVTLNQNKDVPDDLLELAHKYFARLIELGHTIRKRPNFSNSLEKTLSEIRAALDEAFAGDADSKDPFYPPKAHGEGSRSRVHHYGLGVEDSQSFIIIGK
ncbi:hypothetical protein [Pseudoalteromonas sp. GB56]